MAFYPYTYSQLKVPAGTRQILVLIENAEFQAAGELYYRVFNGLPTIDYNVNPATIGYTAISSNNLISVTDNQYVVFSAVGKNTAPVSTTVSVVSMPDFTTIGSFTVNIQTVAGGDVTPNSVNWCNVSANTLATNFIYATQQITGITVPITLEVTSSGSFGSGELYWYVDTNPFPATSCVIDTSSPNGYGMLPVTYPQLITINPNDYLTFGVENTFLFTSQVTITVTNTSDSNTQLDQFVAAVV